MTLEADDDDDPCVAAFHEPARLGQPLGQVGVG